MPYMDMDEGSGHHHALYGCPSVVRHRKTWPPRPTPGGLHQHFESVHNLRALVVECRPAPLEHAVQRSSSGDRSTEPQCDQSAIGKTQECTLQLAGQN